jgi:hypothetical protein
MIGALRKLFTGLLFCFCQLRLWHLGLILCVLGNYCRGHFLRSCMMQKYECIMHKCIAEVT